MELCYTESADLVTGFARFSCRNAYVQDTIDKESCISLLLTDYFHTRETKKRKKMRIRKGYTKRLGTKGVRQEVCEIGIGCIGRTSGGKHS